MFSKNILLNKVPTGEYFALYFFKKMQLAFLYEQLKTK